MLKKIDTHKINYKPNVEMFIWKSNNLIENQTKQNKINYDSHSIKY
jgi:hypothetical protein